MIITKRKTTRRAYEIYRGTDKKTLYDAFSKPSQTKECVWNMLEDMLTVFDGKDLKVISHNCQFFTAGFVGTYYHDKQKHKTFFHITPNNTYLMFLD